MLGCLNVNPCNTLYDVFMDRGISSEDGDKLLSNLGLHTRRTAELEQCLVAMFIRALTANELSDCLSFRSKDLEANGEADSYEYTNLGTL